ncbi:hypothetical protein J6590_004563 [Homalodisca vitripennis]|nr:hypothetical protein J6590_004563 [Homalodisca vitripennis]
MGEAAQRSHLQELRQRPESRTDSERFVICNLAYRVAGAEWRQEYKMAPHRKPSSCDQRSGYRHRTGVPPTRHPPHCVCKHLVLHVCPAGYMTALSIHRRATPRHTSALSVA